MSEDAEADRRPAGRDPLLAASLGAAANSPHYDELISRQIRLAELQVDSLEKQDEYELSHLRWRRFNDQMKGALQIMLVAVGLLVVIGIATAMWNASHADGIVVEAFPVPPSFAASGVGGDVVADDVTNKITAIRDTASGNSFARSKDVHNGRDEDIKVEIPETGVSLAQAWRYLKAWLGHERPLRGNIRNTGGGKIALTVALAGDSAVVVAGPATDLDRLEQQGAEHVFASVDPSNYVLYLDAQNRDAEAYAVISHLARSAADPIERSGYMSLWSGMTRGVTGDIPLSLARARYSLVLNPKMPVAHREIMAGALLLGHDEGALAEAQILLMAHEEDFPPAFQGQGFAALMGAARLERDAATGDFLGAQQAPCFYCSPPDALLQRAEYDARIHDAARSRADVANALASGEASPVMWAEALIAKNRSDLALAKFADADKCAPNWSRLHLKWGEALYWSSDKAEARKEFAVASHLDLTPSERIELAKARDHS